MAEGTANESYFLLTETGIPLPGVRDQGDLTAFQRLVLELEAKRQSDEIKKEHPDTEDRPNSGSLPNGGGHKSQFTERKRYTNLSEKTGKPPEQLIAEYKAKHNLND